MSNPSKKKGTDWEVELLGRLRTLFGNQVERASNTKGIHDYGDYLGVPFLIEAKSTMLPKFQEWARKATAKAGRAWCVIWHGDRRKSGNGPYVLMPLEFFEVLVIYALDNYEYARSRLQMIEDDCRQELGGK